MSGALYTRLRLTIVAAVAFAVSAEGGAQDKAAGAEGPSARPTALEGAKKDFEGIKSIREESRLPAGSLPSFNVPELSPQSPSPAILVTPKDPTREPRKDNWLVDAMEKTKNARDGGMNSRLRDSRRKNGAEEGVGATGEFEPQGSRKSGSEKESDSSTSTIVINPLTRFLGEWMTPQDYALLKPGPTPAFDPREGAANFASMTPPGTSLTLGGLNDFAFGGQTTASPMSARPLQRDNPYLESIPREGPSRVNIANPGGRVHSAGPAPLVPAPIAPPPAQAPTPTKIPEFAKPPPDDRYFKQLKRF